MKIVLCIDDTDEKGGPGTGHLAQALGEAIEEKQWGKCSAISRHQLFVHDDIPYTSHNSSLCFEAAIRDEVLNDLIDYCGNFLQEKGAPGSDPGLCVAVVDTNLKTDRLKAFGLNAKKTVLTKEDAYNLAKELNIHLSEHGGTGQGVVGAVAGTGLRLSGNDGRFRGWFHLGKPGESMSVKELKSYSFFDSVKSETGEILHDDSLIMFGGYEMKPVLQDSKQVLLVERVSDESETIKWKTLTKQQVKRY